ncbi:MAG: ribonuclease P protein component [Ignavibacteriales bacterium]|nr:ribonuclease P protein component [Ignavibacteriales bacterium]
MKELKAEKILKKLLPGAKQHIHQTIKLGLLTGFPRSPIKMGVMFAVAVGKKLGNAVWRNRVKRLAREAYRLNKIGLVEKYKTKNALLEIIFSPQSLNQIKNKRIGLSDIEPPIKEIIAKLIEKI